MATATSITITGPRPARRRRWLLLALTVAIVTAGAATATASASQRDHLSQAQGTRDASRRDLDAALARARADGLTGSDLAPASASEASIVAEPTVPSRWGIFDGGEIAHLSSQVRRLRGLAVVVGQLETAAAAGARTSAATEMAQYQAAIDAAQAAGMDVSVAAAAITSLEGSLATASTPAAVALATDGLGQRIADLRQQTAAKKAADAAAARAKAQLDSARATAGAALTRAQTVLGQAQQFPQLQIGDAPAAVAAAAQAYATATTAGQFDAVTTQANAISGPLTTTLVFHADAYSAMASARRSLQDAATYHVDPGTTGPQLDALQAQLDAAGTADSFKQITAQINLVVAPLLDRIGVASLGVGKVIVISLDRQSLSAYQDGQAVLTTLVTTGRAALPTPPGNYTVMSKSHPFEMISPWPQGSPYWYAPSWVQYVLWFRSGGYGIHDAPWRSAYGPGTEAAGSHGCVNVPYATMVQLYNWADTDTRVIVH